MNIPGDQSERTISMSSAIRFFGVSVLLAAYCSVMFSGNTGKIVGKVTDAQTGDPLPSVNILVVNTTRGANTDLDGKYTIIGIPLGDYVVRASQVGYQTAQISGVKVGADETTPLNFKLLSTAVEIQGVTTTADQQMVNSLTTSSSTTVNAKSIENIPNVKSVEDVLRLQVGVVKQGNNLFLRGGRSNEVQYLVDGIPSNSILGNSGSLTTAGSNEELSKLYAGVQSGTVGGGSSGVAVSASAIQSVSVQTSGFDADYGNAQSGVINIVTKSGSDRYSGSVQYRTDRISNSNQNENFSSFSFGGPEPLTKYLMSDLGVQIPGTLTFFFNADMDRSDGPYNYDNNEFYHPIERKVQLNGFLGGMLNGLGYRYKDNQVNNFTFDSKLKYDPSGSDQIFYRYGASLSSGHGYINAWKYRADSSALSATLGISHVLSWTHFFSPNSFLRVNLGREEKRDGNDVAGTKPTDYSSSYQDRDPNNDGFNDLGSDQRWYDALTRVWTAHLDFNSQGNPLHLLKAGLEVNYEEINSTEILRPTVPIQINGVLTSPPFSDPMYSHGEYPGYGSYRWNLNNYPERGGMYLQDNIEFSGLNIHVGMRYDYFDIGRQVYYDDFIRNWETALNGNIPPNSPAYLGADWVANQDSTDVTDPGGKTHRTLRTGYFLDDMHRFLYYATHGQVSPRLSIGYPVTDRIVFYFNYGHFLQFPDRENYFRDPTITGLSGNSVGNPNLKPQRTIAYEAGFEDQFNEEMSFKLHAFYKDDFDYTTSFSREGNNFLRNFDYASTRGFEITFDRRTTNFEVKVSYSYQLAKGRSSNTLAGIFEPQYQLPRETRLDFDQNHTANVFATYRVSPKEQGTFFGLPFVNNYGISLTWNFGSGFPYTPVVGKTTIRNVYLHNNETKPFTSTVNLSMYKGLYLMDRLNMMVTLDVTNLFNRRNVNVVNDQGSGSLASGDPPKYGDYSQDGSVIYPWYQADARLDPTIFAAMRQIILGIRLNWE